MNLRWRMPCCAEPAPEPHEPDTARPHISLNNAAHERWGKLRSKSAGSDLIRYASLISQWNFLRRCNRRNACEKCGLSGASGKSKQLVPQSGVDDGGKAERRPVDDASGSRSARGRSRGIGAYNALADIGRRLGAPGTDCPARG